MWYHVGWDYLQEADRLSSRGRENKDSNMELFSKSLNSVTESYFIQ